MIIKILESQKRSVNGAIGYNRKKEKEIIEEYKDVDAILNYNKKAKSQLLTIENSVDDIDTFRRTLNEINSQGRVKYPLFHVSINFPPDEEVSDDMMLKIAREYMADMGYGRQPYAVWRHFDRLHPHVHIVSTRVDRRTFKKIYDGLENVRSTQLAEKYEKKYNLQKTKHTRGREIKRGSVGVRSRIDDVLEQVLRERPYSMQTFKEALSRYNIRVKEGERKSVFFVEIDESGREGRLFESSKLTAFAHKSVRQRLQINRVLRNRSRVFIKDSVTLLLQRYGEKGLDERQFVAELKQSGIHVRYQKNSGGIYGISFYHKGFDLKGSEVDKFLSWENLRKYVRPAEQSKQKGRIYTTQVKNRSNSHAGSLRRGLAGIFQGSYDDNEPDEEEERLQEQNAPRLK